MIASRNSGERTLSGWISAQAVGLAQRLDGGGCGDLPRPAGRSGRVTTSATSCPATSMASSAGTAVSGVPMKTTLTEPAAARRWRTQSPALIRFLIWRFMQLALQRGQVLEKTRPSRCSISCCIARASSPRAAIVNVVAVQAPAPRPSRRMAARCRGGMSGNERQPSSATLAPGGLDDPRVDENVEIFFLLTHRQDRRHTTRFATPTLVRGQPDSRGRVHGLDHVLERASRCSSSIRSTRSVGVNRIGSGRERSADAPWADGSIGRKRASTRSSCVGDTTVLATVRRGTGGPRKATFRLRFLPGSRVACEVHWNGRPRGISPEDAMKQRASNDDDDRRDDRGPRALQRRLSLRPTDDDGYGDGYQSGAYGRVRSADAGGTIVRADAESDRIRQGERQRPVVSRGRCCAPMATSGSRSSSPAGRP